MENELVEKSFYCTSGVSLQEFQNKVKSQEFWQNGNEFDKNRLMEPDSQLMKAFMKWARPTVENRVPEVLSFLTLKFLTQIFFIF